MSDTTDLVAEHDFDTLPLLCDFLGYVRTTAMSARGEFSVTFVLHEDCVPEAIQHFVPQAIGFPRRIQIRDFLPPDE